MASASKTISLNVTANTAAYIAELRKLGTHTEKEIGTAARKASATFQKVELENIAAAKKAAGEIDKAHSAVYQNIAAGALAASAAIVAGFQQAIEQTVAMRTGLDELSTTSGLATETLAGLAYAARQNGKELSAFDSVLRDFPKRMMETSEGTGEALKGFDGLGVSVTDAAGKMRSADAVLNDVLTALRGIEDPAMRSALATRTFGGDGAKLMQVLGGAELEDFVAYAKEFGADVGPEAIATAVEWRAAQAGLSIEFERITSQIADVAISVRSLEGFTTGLFVTFEVGKRVVSDLAAEFFSLEGVMKAVFSGGILPIIGLGMALDDATTEVAALVTERQRLKAELDASAGTTASATDAVAQLAEQQSQAAKSAREWEAAQRQLANELDKMLSIQDRLYSVVDTAENDRRNSIVQTNIAYQAQIVEVSRLAAEALVLAKTDEDRIALREAEIDAIDALTARRDRELAQLKGIATVNKMAIFEAEQLAMAKEAAAKAALEQAKNEKLYQNALQQTGALFSQVAGLMKEGSKEAAIAARLAAIVQATVATFAAANQALAVPIVGPALAAATTAVGLANVAQIVSTPIPAFARGGVMTTQSPAYGNASEERLATMRPGEEVLTPAQQAMRNAPQTTTVNLKLSNRTLQTTILEAERNGRAVSRAIGAPQIRHYRDRMTA